MYYYVILFQGRTFELIRIYCSLDFFLDLWQVFLKIKKKKKKYKKHQDKKKS